MEELDDLLNKIRIQTESVTGVSYNRPDGQNLPPPMSTTDSVGVDFKPQKKVSLSEYTPYSENTVMTTLSDGSKVSNFKDFYPGTNNEERLANEDTYTEQWGNGFAKLGLKTVNAVVGGTVGVVYGLGSALINRDASKIYDNKFSNWMGDLDTKLGYQFANYYTEQEKNAGVFDQMKQANFWADKFLGGLAFTSGAIMSEGIWGWATGGTSLATAGARIGGKIAGLGRAGRWGVEAIGEANVIAGLAKNKSLFTKGLDFGADVLNLTDDALKARKWAVRGGQAGQAISIVARAGRSAGYEASVEALQYKKEAEENFYRNFASMNGREPDAEEISKFKAKNDSTANTVFATNMGIVSLSNFVGLGHVLNIKNPINLGITDFINKKAFGYGIDATGIVVKGTTRQLIARNAFDYLVKPSFTEGLFEEGLQGVTNKTANKWIEHTYNPKYTNENFNQFDAFYDAVQEQYGTEKGWKDNILGMLIGVAGGGTNIKGAQNQKNSELEFEASAARTYNSNTMQAMLLPARVQSANREAGFTEAANQDEQDGKFASAQINKIGALTTYANTGFLTGETVKSMSENIRGSLDAMTKDQWSEAGVSEENIESEKTEKIKEFEGIANAWKTNKQYVQYIVGNRMVGEQNLEGTKLEGIFGSFSKNTQVVEALAWQLTVGEQSGRIMDDVRVKIGEEVGTENAKVIQTLTDLQNQPKAQRKEISNLSKIAFSNRTLRDNLTQRIVDIDKTGILTEPQKLSRNKLSNELIKADAKLLEAEQKLDKIASEISATKKYQTEIGGVKIVDNLLTGTELLDLDKNVAKFKAILDKQENLNPQRAQYLKDLLEEHNVARDMFMQAKTTQKALVSKEFKTENIDGWLSKLFKNGKEMNPNAKDWFEDSINKYSDFKAKLISGSEELAKDQEAEKLLQDEVVSGTISPETLQTIADKTNLTKVEQEIYNNNKEAIDELRTQKNLETKPKSQEQINQEKVDALEVERAESLAKVKPADVVEQQIKNIILTKETITLEQVDEIISKIEDKKEIDSTPITKNEVREPIDFVSLFGNISRVLSDDFKIDLVNAKKKLKTYLKEIHPDKFTDNNLKNIAGLFTASMIDSAKEGSIEKLDKLYLAFIEIKDKQEILSSSQDNTIIYRTGYFGNGIDQNAGYRDSNKDLTNEYGTLDGSIDNFPEYKGYKTKVTEKNGKKLISLHFKISNLESTRTGGHAAIAFEMNSIVKVDNDLLDNFIPLVDKFKNDNFEDANQDGKLRPIKNFDEFIKPDFTNVKVKPIDNTTTQIITTKETISDKEFNNFTDSNTVSDNILQDITNKIKNNSPLSIREVAIYSESKNAKKVEELLKRKSNTRTQEQVDAEKNKINSDFDKKIEALKPPSQNPVEQYKQRINKMFNELYDDLDMVNQEDLEAERPTEKEIEEYKKTPTEALKKKLQNWLLLDASTDDGYTSIVDLLDNIKQHETQVEEIITKEQVTNDEAENLVEKSEGAGNKDAKDVTNISTEPITYKEIKNSDKVELSHIKAEYILTQLGQEYKHKRDGKYLDVPNAKNMQIGDVIEVDNISFSMVENYRLEFKKKDFKAREQVLNLYVEEKQNFYNSVSVYSVINGERVKAPSQFDDQVISRESSFDIKIENELELVVDDTDGFNKTVKGNTQNEFKIYLKDKNGNIVQNLKSGETKYNSEFNQSFADLRLKAFENWVAAGRPNKMDLGITVKVTDVLLAAPELLFSDGKMIEGDINFDETQQVIIAKGYIQNGELTLDNEVGEVSKVYVGRMTKNSPDLKVPIVVFKVGVNTIAFPITMKQKATPIDFEGLLQGTPQEVVKKINQAIIDNNIKTAKLIFSDVTISPSGETQFSENAQKAKEAFENNTSFTTADTLARKDYKTENLVNDATIRINLTNVKKVFSAPKLRIDIAGVVIKQPKDVIAQNTLTLDEKASQLHANLYDQVYITNWDSIFKDSTSNQFAPIIIDGYMEGNKSVIPTSAETVSKYKDREKIGWSNQRRDKKVLDKALEQIFDVETVKLKISKKEKEQLGDKLIKDMTNYLIERESLTKQTDTNQKETKNGEDNIC